MRAKSIGFEELAGVGADVSKFLKKNLKVEEDTKIGFFPQFGIAGGIRPIEDLEIMKLKDLHGLSDELNRGILSKVADMDTTVVIKDRHIIFGGDLGGLGGLGGVGGLRR